MPEPNFPTAGPSADRRRHRVAVIAAVVMVLVVCGCGARSSAGTGTADPAAANETQQALYSLYDNIHGTAAQRAAGEYVRYRTTHDPIRSCMSSAGFTYRVSFMKPDLGHQNFGSTLDTRWLAPVDTPDLISGPAQQLVASQRELDSANITVGRDLPEGYSAALNRCQSSHPSDHESTGEAPDPTGLLGKYHALLSGGDVAFDAGSSYRSCMSAAGFMVADFQDLLRQIEQRVPDDAAVPAIGSTDGPAWQAFLAYERTALTTDSDCRRETRARALSDMSAATTNFTDQYATELTTIHASWMAIAGQQAALRDN